MYATEQDIIDRYGSDALLIAFDRDNSGEVAPDSVNKALADAQSEIDGYLSGVESLPLTNPPALLTRLAVDIALYQGSSSTAQTDEKRTRYEDAVSYLRRVAEGRIKLAKPENVTTTVSDTAAISTPAQVFTPDRLDRF